MHARRFTAYHLVAAVVFAAAPVAAQKPTASLPPVTAQGTLYVADCQDRALPSQREVGEWTGQHNFSQVYATRQRLMAEIGRACQQTGVEQVRVVLEKTNAAAMDLVAIADPNK